MRLNDHVNANFNPHHLNSKYERRKKNHHLQQQTQTLQIINTPYARLYHRLSRKLRLRTKTSYE